MNPVIGVLLLFGALILLDVLALRYGYDSRDLRTSEFVRREDL